MVKICSKCLKSLSLNEFPKNKKGKFQRAEKCKACSAKLAALYRQRDKFGLKRLGKYNISDTEYKQLLLSSGGVCEICKLPPKLPKKYLCIDHDHTTLKVRGLLCEDCNLALGRFKDSVDYLYRAITYLKKKYG